MRPASRLGLRLARLKLRLATHVEVGSTSQVAPSAVFATEYRDGERIVVGERCQIHRGVVLATYGGSIELGDDVSINPYSVLYGHGGVRVGSYVRIATHVVIVAANHVYEDETVPIALQPLTRSGIEIEDDVWIGAHATVLDGVRIGHGSVVAAGAVVTRSVPPSAVVAGVPARPIGSRARGDVVAV